VILLDTQIWVWWVNGAAQLAPRQLHHIQTNQAAGLGVSIISCWEVAKLVERGRLQLAGPVLQWLHQALASPGVLQLDLTPEIAVESTQLPLPFHRDPADQIIVATARIHAIPLLTADARLLQYPHVTTLT